MISRRLGGASVFFTDRHGGVSAAPFDTCNLARHVDDDPAAVAENHRRVLDAAGAADAAWVQPHHVHGTTVLAVTDASRDGDEGDGAATARPGLALVAIGADCAPVAIANDTACAAVHAGWRGAVDGVVAAGVAAVRALGRGPVRGVIGPCVCARHYEFGADLLADLAARVGPHVAATTDDGRPALDLRATLLEAFAREDVTAVEVLDVCTVESPDHYSFRRDGRTGRHGVVVLRNP